MIESRRILGVRVDGSDYESVTRRIVAWAAEGASRYICLGAVNNIMEARDRPGYREVLEGAALVTSDGMPLVWLLRGLGVGHARRVYGPDLMPLVLEAAARAGLPVGFYGGTPRVLARLIDAMRTRFPSLEVAYAESPPFRPPTAEEDERTTRNIAAAGVRILFLGTGSPKQDDWMYAHRGRIPAVMLGVGAAFDFLAGAKPQAPRWMQSSGLEWLFRLATEPRRLGRRYLKQNPRFLILALAQIARARLGPRAA
jgi:N-acetylglucosaminyldiphosphoundecaprenol N-acetyl-beta-D-mannosaminyltransferase